MADWWWCIVDLWWSSRFSVPNHLEQVSQSYDIVSNDGMSANKTILDQPAKETYILPINAQNPIIYRHALYSTWISLSHIDCHVCFYVYMIIYDHPCKIIQIFLHVAIKVTTETHRCTPGVSIRGMQLSRWSWQTFVQSKPANCGCFQLFTLFFSMQIGLMF